MKARNASTQIKNTPFSFSCSFPSTLPNGTLARPNNGILNVNLLDDGFNAVVCSRGGLFRGVCWTCAEGGVVGSDGTLSSTEHGDGSARLFDEREAVYTGGHSVNPISGVGDCVTTQTVGVAEALYRRYPVVVLGLEVQQSSSMTRFQHEVVAPRLVGALPYASLNCPCHGREAGVVVKVRAFGVAADSGGSTTL